MRSLLTCFRGAPSFLNQKEVLNGLGEGRGVKEKEDGSPCLPKRSSAVPLPLPTSPHESLNKPSRKAWLTPFYRSGSWGSERLPWRWSHNEVPCTQSLLNPKPLALGSSVAWTCPCDVWRCVRLYRTQNDKLALLPSTHLFSSSCRVRLDRHVRQCSPYLQYNKWNDLKLIPATPLERRKWRLRTKHKMKNLSYVMYLINGTTFGNTNRCACLKGCHAIQDNIPSKLQHYQMLPQT